MNVTTFQTRIFAAGRCGSQRRGKHLEGTEHQAHSKLFPKTSDRKISQPWVLGFCFWFVDFFFFFNIKTVAFLPGDLPPPPCFLLEVSLVQLQI